MLDHLIKEKKAGVAIVGLGYVGLPTAIAIAEAGFEVVGVDVNEQRVKQLNNGRSFIAEIPNEAIKNISKKFSATTKWSEIKKCRVVIIAVPTPLTKNKTPDTSFIENATRNIAPHLSPESLVILESTTYPGTTEELVKSLLPKCYLAFAPERIDPGNKNFKFREVPKVVGGIDQKSTELACLFYSNLINKVVPVQNARTAEMTKLLENIFRLVNISMVNELKLLADRMDIDFWEVIEAAKTKPLGFYPFYPGPGVGGHCFEENQRVIVDNGLELQSLTVKEIYRNTVTKTIRSLSQVFNQNSTTITKAKPRLNLACPQTPLKVALPENQKILLVSSRDTDRVINIFCHYNYQLRLTDKHPVFVFDQPTNQIKLKFADNIVAGDFLVMPKKIPNEKQSLIFDLIDIVRKGYPNLLHKLRIKPCHGNLSKFKFLKKDYRKGNYLPLIDFLKIEEKLRLKRADLLLGGGRGPSANYIPAVITIDQDWARLIGYYLSEGCLTDDKKTLRLRWTFHSKEHEYINDLERILKNKGVRFSSYQDKQWQSFHIKVSSRTLGLFFRDVLRTGTNCYEMRIPRSLFFSTPKIRQEILSGILRGDGGVYMPPKKHRYFKNDRYYIRQNNAVEISYFTSSTTLFEQVQIILHENGVIPYIEKRVGLITIRGQENAKKLINFFDGEKRRLIAYYLSLIKKKNDFHLTKEVDDYLFIKVKEVKGCYAPQVVYSLEVDKTNTLLTTGGILVHNCIPLDPFYLSWKARELGFFARFIELAGEINELMPHHIVTKIIGALNRKRKSLNGSKILVLGVAYKKDIDDPRESPALEIIKILMHKKAIVIYNDPHIPQIVLDGEKIYSSPLTPDLLKRVDCVAITTDHSAYDYKLISRKAKLIVDTRNAIKERRDNIIK